MRWLQRLAPYALASALLIGLKQSPAVEPFPLHPFVSYDPIRFHSHVVAGLVLSGCARNGGNRFSDVVD